MNDECKAATKARKAARHSRQVRAAAYNRNLVFTAWQRSKAIRFLKRHLDEEVAS